MCLLVTKLGTPSCATGEHKIIALADYILAWYSWVYFKDVSVFFGGLDQ